MGFLTEKAIETMLILESRRLPMPAGGSRVFSASRVFWQAYDELTGPAISVPTEQVVEYALEGRRISGSTFEACFYDYVACLHAALAPPWFPRYLPRSSSRCGPSRSLPSSR